MGGKLEVSGEDKFAHSDDCSGSTMSKSYRDDEDDNITEDNVADDHVEDEQGSSPGHNSTNIEEVEEDEVPTPAVSCCVAVHMQRQCESIGCWEWNSREQRWVQF